MKMIFAISSLASGYHLRRAIERAGGRRVLLSYWYARGDDERVMQYITGGNDNIKRNARGRILKGVAP